MAGSNVVSETRALEQIAEAFDRQGWRNYGSIPAEMIGVAISEDVPIASSGPLGAIPRGFLRENEITLEIVARALAQALDNLRVEPTPRPTVSTVINVSDGGQFVGILGGHGNRIDSVNQQGHHSISESVANLIADVRIQQSTEIREILASSDDDDSKRNRLVPVVKKILGIGMDGATQVAAALVAAQAMASG